MESTTQNASVQFVAQSGESGDGASDGGDYQNQEQDQNQKSNTHKKKRKKQTEDEEKNLQQLSDKTQKVWPENVNALQRTDQDVSMAEPYDFLASERCDITQAVEYCEDSSLHFAEPELPALELLSPGPALLESKEEVVLHDQSLDNILSETIDQINWRQISEDDTGRITPQMYYYDSFQLLAESLRADESNVNDQTIGDTLAEIKNHGGTEIHTALADSPDEQEQNEIDLPNRSALQPLAEDTADSATEITAEVGTGCPNVSTSSKKKPKIKEADHDDGQAPKSAPEAERDY